LVSLSKEKDDLHEQHTSEITEKEEALNNQKSEIEAKEKKIKDLEDKVSKALEGNSQAENV
jgi:hypothetical protein